MPRRSIIKGRVNTNRSMADFRINPDNQRNEKERLESMTKLTVRIIVFALISTLPVGVSCEEAVKQVGSSGIEVNADPGFSMPIGESTKVFSFGSGNSVSVGYVTGYSPSYFIGAELGYNFTALVKESNISLFSGGARAGARIRLLPALETGVYAGGGYFFGVLNSPYVYGGNSYSPSGGNPYFCGGVELALYLSRDFSLGINAAYRNYLGFSQDVTAGIGIAYRASFEAIEALEQQNIQTEPLFPALMQVFYSKTGFGKATFRNKSENPVTKLRVRLEVPGYAAEPVQLAGADTVEPGKQTEIPLFASFIVKSGDFIEEREIKAEIITEYIYTEQPAYQRFQFTIKVRRVTDFSWSNPEYITAFVTQKAQTVEALASLVSESIKGKGNKEIPQNLQLAIGLQNAISAQKVVFAQDAKTPYKDYSANPKLTDSIQFPETTLTRRTGDSDELALLYSSLFEAAGIETALIRVPGQMLIAFLPGITESDISLRFFHSDKLITMNGKRWLPFDCIDNSGSFIKALTAGSEKWIKAKGDAQFYQVRPSQENLKFLSPPDATEKPTLPDKADEEARFAKSLDEFISWELESKAAEVRKEIQKTGSNSVLMNRLGVLYGRYGLYAKALDIFSQVILKDEYVPSLVNIGNIYYKENELNKALPFYDRAYRQAPLDVYTLLGLAKINHKLENYGNARDAYNKLKSIDPALAAKYSYLELKGDEARLTAKLSEEKEEVVWIVE